jgi:dTMP kinase
VPFVVGSLGRRRVNFLAWHSTVDGTRFVLVAGGLLALAAGLLAYRKMDDRQQMDVWTDFTTSFRRNSEARRRLSNGSLFVAFEGGEGSGKSTQVQLMADIMREAGHRVCVTHEPGGTALGERVRELVLHAAAPVTPRAEVLLFAADRAHHVDTVIKPALDSGAVVLTDRYVDSSLAYQGAGRNLNPIDVRRISRWATGDLRPDLTVLLDIPAAEGLARARGRGEADKLEGESLAFHERVRAAFRGLAEAHPRRYLVVDATLPPVEIATLVQARIDALLAPRRNHRKNGKSGGDVAAGAIQVEAVQQ